MRYKGDFTLDKVCLNKKIVLFYFLLVFSCLFCVANAQDRKSTLVGEFRTHVKFHSKYLAQDRDVVVWLPPGYSKNAKQRYPVFYMHDGQNLFDEATSFLGKEWKLDETATELIENKKIAPIILVGIYNAGNDRLDEYTPTKDAKFKRGGKADTYGKMLVEELKPFIDRAYRTKRSAKDTGLGGSSLGGLVTLYLGLKYPQVFGNLAVVSPSVWWDDKFIIRFLKENREPKNRLGLKIWLDMGTKEGESAIPDVHLLRDLLLEKGWKEDKDLRYREIEGAEHNEKAWSERFPEMLLFLYGYRAQKRVSDVGQSKT